MPLLELQGSEDMMAVDVSRKRSHDEYSSDDELSSVASEDVAMFDAPNNDSPSQTKLPSLKPNTNPPSDNLKHATDSTTHQHKRKRLTATEKAAKLEEESLKKREKEEARLAKLAEKAKADAEKAAAKAKIDAERQASKAKAEAEKAAKQAERDEKKRKKEEEDRRIQEEKDKKERSQLRLNSFFKRPLPTKTNEKSATGTPAKNAETTIPTSETVNDYRKTFKPFFIKESVRVAPLAVETLDPETRAAKAKILDEYISKKCGTDIQVVPFRPIQSLNLPLKIPRRGVVYPPVKQLVETIHEQAFDDKSVQVSRTQLRRIPIKTLFFSTDVRPPYCGTLTGPQYAYGRELMARAARRPKYRVFPSVAYDYDSEAEWVDDEMGEDVDLDDDEEEIDDEDDMDGFLDDSEDAGIARGLLSNSMDPESTGICFETGQRQTTVPELYTYRMEFVLDSLSPTGSINPFSTEYWEPEAKRTKPAQTGGTTTNSKMPPPPTTNTPANAFEALVAPSSNIASATSEASTASTLQVLELKRPELLPEIKKVIMENAKLSKLGLVDVLFHKIDGLSKGEAKMALDVLATKVGVGRAKEWALKDSE
ncbi:Chromatin assembly factor 1 subunit rlf2 [Ceratocystis platani]|uniref:Chromatin assembly factor 1 subunit rlf2 n=1 Tax=Ceratocystis fimbriata f. sp. platani TaxID=88771 RepID=A0A0F8CUJ6_CERFI|nr:Chromatin assembly factor 1 subunit rlf2 [Ceratocystis platani]